MPTHSFTHQNIFKVHLECARSQGAKKKTKLGPIVIKPVVLAAGWGGGVGIREGNGNINDMCGLTAVMEGTVRSQRMEWKGRTRDSHTHAPRGLGSQDMHGSHRDPRAARHSKGGQQTIQAYSLMRVSRYPKSNYLHGQWRGVGLNERRLGQ